MAAIRAFYGALHLFFFFFDGGAFEVDRLGGLRSVLLLRLLRQLDNSITVFAPLLPS